MHLEITGRRGEGFFEVKTEHKEKHLIWSTVVFSKVRLTAKEDVFEDINGFLATLPEEKQDAIWEAYVKLHGQLKEHLGEINDSASPNWLIRKMVERLYSHIDMDNLQRWLLLKGGLYLPPDTDEELDPNGRHPNIDQTYLRSHYIELATFALATRLAVPIWGEYLGNGGGGLSDEMHKEMDALSLIYNTQAMRWPEELSARDKLEKYIEIRISNPSGSTKKRATTKDASQVSLWKGVGSSEVSLRLLAMVVLRRLAIVPLTKGSKETNIVANVHNYVLTKLQPQDRRTDRVIDKRNEQEARSEDDKTSSMEEYKIKQRIPDGDAVLYDVESQHTERLVKTVDPTIDMRKVEACMRCIPRMERSAISIHQILVAQWVMAKAYPPRAFDYIHKTSTVRLLAMSQALLWHWGFLDLALLMQVRKHVTANREIPGLRAGARPAARINRQTQQELLELFPYTFPQAGSGDNERKGNPALIGITRVIHEIFSASWEYLGPDKLRAESDQPKENYSATPLLVVPIDIKNSISKAVIHITHLNL